MQNQDRTLLKTFVLKRICLGYGKTMMMNRAVQLGELSRLKLFAVEVGTHATVVKKSQ